MLVLGRKPGQYIMIGEDIKVEVVKNDNGDLRIAIQAPKDIEIVRGELLDGDSNNGKNGNQRSS